MAHAESPEPNPEKLFVNDGQLEPEQIGTLKPTAIDTPLEEVRRREVSGEACQRPLGIDCVINFFGR